jgi:hypothetical protein
MSEKYSVASTPHLSLELIAGLCCIPGIFGDNEPLRQFTISAASAGASSTERGKEPRYEQWDEDSTPHRALLLLDAGTYKVERVFTNPPGPSPRRSPDYLVSPKGSFAYMNAVLPRGAPIPLYGSNPGRTLWNGEVVLPMLIDMRRECRTGKPFSQSISDAQRVTWGALWMSLTPAEMISQRSGIARASGKVVIGGLGLGWFLRKVCEKDCVEEVVVVERSQELLDWYGYDLCKKYPKVKEVICNDVYEEFHRHGDHQFLLDIWPIYQGARQDKRLRPLRKEMGRRLWAWGLD